MTSLHYEDQKIPSDLSIKVAVVVHPSTMAQKSADRPNSVFVEVSFKHTIDHANNAEGRRILQQSAEAEEPLRMELDVSAGWCQTIRFPQVYCEGKRVFTSMFPDDDPRSSKLVPVTGKVEQGMIFKGTLPLHGYTIRRSSNRSTTTTTTAAATANSLLATQSVITVHVKYHSHVLIPQTSKPDPVLAKQSYLGLPLLGSHVLNAKRSSSCEEGEGEGCATPEVKVDLHITMPVTAGLYSSFTTEMLLKDPGQPTLSLSEQQLLGCCLVEKNAAQVESKRVSVYPSRVVDATTGSDIGDRDWEQDLPTSSRDPSRLVGSFLEFQFLDVTGGLRKARPAGGSNTAEGLEHFLILGDSSLNVDEGTAKERAMVKQLNGASTLTLLMKKPIFVVLAVLWLIFWFRGAFKFLLPSVNQNSNSGGYATLQSMTDDPYEL